MRGQWGADLWFLKFCLGTSIFQMVQNSSTNSITTVLCCLFNSTFSVVYLLWGKYCFSFNLQRPYQKAEIWKLHALIFQKSSLWRSKLFHKSYFTGRNCLAYVCYCYYSNPYTNIHIHTHSTYRQALSYVIDFFTLEQGSLFLFLLLFHLCPL